MDAFDLGEIKDKINLRGISRPAACGLVVVLLLVACVCAVLFFQGQGGGIEIASAAAKDSTPPSEESTGASSVSDAPQASIFVHVTGCVNAPGLIELPEKSRVANAIEAAGGFKEDADSASINLARELSDGEQIYVTSMADGLNAAAVSAAGEGAGGTSSASGTSGAAGPASGTAAATAGAKININKASASELTTLPGIGNSTAEKIVSDRKVHGAFAKVEDLTRVSGIGEKKLEAIRELICV